MGVNEFGKCRVGVNEFGKCRDPLLDFLANAGSFPDILTQQGMLAVSYSRKHKVHSSDDL